VSGAETLRGYVDMKRGKLVQLEPGPGAEVECQPDSH
jgi:hypothetical protein